MKVLKVSCQGCGSTLDVDDFIRYATCNYCHASLEVMHDPSVTHTRLLEKLDRNTGSILEEVRFLRLQSELAHLDQSWSSYLETSPSHEFRGGRWISPRILSILVGLGMIALGGNYIANSRGYQGLPGLFLIALGIYTLVSRGGKEDEFQVEYARYKEQRARLVQEIEVERTGSSQKPAKD